MFREDAKHSFAFYFLLERDGRGQAPAGLPTAIGSFVKVEIRADVPAYPAWAVPAAAYFRRTGEGWALVGFERLP